MSGVRHDLRRRPWNLAGFFHRKLLEAAEAISSEGSGRPTEGLQAWRSLYLLGGLSERDFLRAKELLMQAVPGTYAMSWTEIQQLDIKTFDRLLSDKAKMIEAQQKRGG